MRLVVFFHQLERIPLRTHVLKCWTRLLGSSKMRFRRRRDSTSWMPWYCAAIAFVPACWCMNLRCSRKVASYDLPGVKFWKPHNSYAKTDFGRLEVFNDNLLRMSSAECLSLRMIMVWPRTVIELIGPYRSLNLSQCWNSGVPGGGRSKMLPTMGRGFGPGGRLREAFFFR